MAMISAKLYRYSIDTFNGRFANGWCYHRLYKRKRLTISIVGDGQLIGRTETGEFRKDLKKQGLHATGLCGFDYSFPPGFVADRFQELEIFVTGLDTPLFAIQGNEVETLVPDPAQNVCFMHIPKTAGSSFNAFLRRCYPRDQYAPHLERLPTEALESIVEASRCISGHLPWYRMRTLSKKKSCRLYSIIREPYRHLHSHINYVRRIFTDGGEEAHYDYQHNEAIRILAEKLVRVDFKNDRQATDFVADLVGYELEFFDNIQTRYFLDYRPERVGPADFENARENSKRFSLIGLTEQYERFVKRFCRDLELPPQAELQRANIADQYQLFDTLKSSAGSPLHDLIEFDRRLYRHVADSFWSETGKR